MTIAEKIEMYKGKKRFIDGLSAVFKDNPKGSSVTEISYEVYQKEREGQLIFSEWIVVYFIGGGKVVYRSIGNSNTANFRAIGKLIDGGYYEEIQDYENLESFGYELVVL